MRGPISELPAAALDSAHLGLSLTREFFGCLTAQVAICRAAQGRPAEERNRVLAGYPQSELMWVQEQENQSAGPSIRFEVASRLDRTLSPASRPAAASPASGSAKHTAEEQVEYIDRALTHRARSSGQACERTAPGPKAATR